jgi:tyrosyl-tRNA synthetase
MNKRLVNYTRHLVARTVLHSTTINHTDPNLIANDDYNCAAYCGFDPTAKNLHLGNYLQIVTLARAAQFSIRPIYLMGGATAMIGDPSGKQSARAQLSTEEVLKNSQQIQADLQLILGNLFAYLKTREALEMEEYSMLNNRNFYEGLNIIDFLTRYGFHLNMASMLKREVVARRIQNELPLTYSEFSYQIFQAIDYLILKQQMVD